MFEIIVPFIVIGGVDVDGGTPCNCEFENKFILLLTKSVSNSAINKQGIVWLNINDSRLAKFEIYIYIYIDFT